MILQITLTPVPDVQKDVLNFKGQREDAIKYPLS